MRRKIALLLGVLMILTAVLPILSRASSSTHYIISGGAGEYINTESLKGDLPIENVVLHNSNYKDLMDVASHMMDTDQVGEILLILDPDLVDKKSTEAGKLLESGGDFDTFYKRYKSGNTPRDLDIAGMDSQHIGTVQDYERQNTHITKVESKKISDLENYKSNLDKLVKKAAEKEVELKIALSPIAPALVESYGAEQLSQWINATAEITDVHDYSTSAGTRDPRYFYDLDLPKSGLSTMYIRDIYDLEGYKLENLGRKIEKGSTVEVGAQTAVDNSTELLALMFHNIDDSVPNNANISVARLREVLQTIKDKGYTTVGISEIQDYIYKGTPLPEKPVVLTFDDGYISNYTLGYPVFKEYNAKAVYFPIGHSIGADQYKDTGQSITPHYSLEQMKEMSDSGLIDFGTHGYDIHQVAHLEEGIVMESIIKPDEMEMAEYEELLGEDFDKMSEIFEGTLGFKPTAMAYPKGERDLDSDRIARDKGIVTSFTVNDGTNQLVKGLGQSMFNLNRINIDENVDLNNIFK